MNRIEIGEEGRDMELVISHDKEHWQPPKLQGVTEPRGTSEPFTMDRTPSLKPQVPTSPSMSTTNYLNETVSGSFLPHPKRDALVVPISSLTQLSQMVMQPCSQSLICQVANSFDLHPHWITLPLELLVALHHL